MTVSWRPRPGTRRRPFPAPASRVVLATLLVALLAACGPEAADEDDREFANLTPAPARTATSVLVGSPIVATTDEAIPAQSTPAPGALFMAPTTATSGFFLVDGSVVLVGADGAIRRTDIAGPVEAISVAPGGGSAAVLFRPAPADATPALQPIAAPGVPTGEATPAPTAPVSIAIVDGNGAVVRQVDDVIVKLNETPGVLDAIPVDGTLATVALGPAPDDLLVAFGDGLLVQMPVAGQPRVIKGSGNLAEVTQVSWSPDGKGLAIVAAERPGEPVAVFHTALRADGVDPVRVAPARGRIAGEVAWAPGGGGILFVDAAGPLDAAALRSGRDLFVTPLRSDRRTLVAAAGVIGPAAGVVQFAAAPSGAVAYTLYRAEGDEVRFNSLWVGSLDGQSTVQVTLPDDIAVGGLAWTTAGLVVLSEPASGGPPAALLVGSDAVARPGGGAEAATPAA